MDLEDPLAAFRIGEASTGEDLAHLLERKGHIPDELWRRGGAPVAIAGEALFFVDDGAVYRVPRDAITGLGQTRSADRRMMGLGALLYIVGLPIAFLLPSGLAQVVVGPLAIVAGGVLATLGYLSKALLVQVDDERVPPFVIDHRRWRAIGRSIQSWRELGEIGEGENTRAGGRPG